MFCSQGMSPSKRSSMNPPHTHRTSLFTNQGCLKGRSFWCQNPKKSRANLGSRVVKVETWRFFWELKNTGRAVWFFMQNASSSSSSSPPSPSSSSSSIHPHWLGPYHQSTFFLFNSLVTKKHNETSLDTRFPSNASLAQSLGAKHKRREPPPWSSCWPKPESFKAAKKSLDFSSRAKGGAIRKQNQFWWWCWWWWWWWWWWRLICLIFLPNSKTHYMS